MGHSCCVGLSGGGLIRDNLANNVCQMFIPSPVRVGTLLEVPGTQIEASFCFNLN